MYSIKDIFKRFHPINLMVANYTNTESFFIQVMFLFLLLPSCVLFIQQISTLVFVFEGRI